MKEFEVEIVSKSPYMQSRMDDIDLAIWEGKRGFIIERDDVSKEDLVRAEYRMYRNSGGKPFIPSEHIRGALINGGKFVKAKVGNAKCSMSNIVAGMFSIEPEEIILDESWVIDKRSAFNQKVKARVIVIRPKWEKWEAKFILKVDNDTITDETIKSILAYAGQYVGIGSFNVTHRGMFGRFEIKTFNRIL